MPQTDDISAVEPTVSSSASVPLPERGTHQDTAIVFSTGRSSRKFASFRRLRKRREDGIRSDRCLNCGAYPLTSRYCPDCGQENISFKVPVALLLHDVGEEFIKWDGRLARTILLLLFRPGVLTEQYNLGRRTQFLPPFKIYFVASALFVALVSVLHPISDSVPKLDKKFAQAVHEAEAERTAAAQRHTVKTVMSNAAPATVPPRRTARVKAGGKVVLSDDGLFNTNLFSGGIYLGSHRFKPSDLTYNGHLAEQGQYAPAFDQWLGRIKDKGAPPPRGKVELMRRVLLTIDHPGNVGSNFIGNLGKGIFFLMPFYALLLSAFFRRERRFYIEHLIFAVHLHTFLFTLGMIFQLVSTFSQPLAACMLLLYPVYEFLALRRTYGNTTRKTLVKQFFINQVYGWVLLLGFALIFAFTVASL